MASHLNRNAFILLVISAFFVVGSVSAADQPKRQQRQDPSGGQVRSRIRHPHNDRAADLNKRRQRIAQLKQQIQKDHERVSALREQLQQLNTKIKSRHESDVAAPRVRSKSERNAENVRSQMVVLQQKLALAVGSNDKHRADAVRRRIEQLKTLDSKRSDIRQNKIEQRQEVIRRFEAKIESARQSEQHKFADALAEHLRKLKDAANRDARRN